LRRNFFEIFKAGARKDKGHILFGINPNNDIATGLPLLAGHSGSNR